MGLIILSFVLSYSLPQLYSVSKYILLLVAALLLLDYFILNWVESKLSAKRKLAERLSLGDEQEIVYELVNEGSSKVHIELVDELPFQFQHRDSIASFWINTSSSTEFRFGIKPMERGLYRFGKLFGYVQLVFPGLLKRRVVLEEEAEVKVYPSIIQMRKYELQLASKTATLSGIRRVRRVGENDEFEYIRSYAQGDNIKSINWKATSRKNDLMVNQYQNTRSQLFYTIIDKGRSMKMPFYGMTLLDHSINTALVISNIILKKYDRAGLITFSDKMGTIVKAESTQHQLERITRQLYDQRTGFLESNFEMLYYNIRKNLSRRSILLFFTNFETKSDLDRNMKYLKAISRMHLLILVIFINDEILETTHMTVETRADIYLKTFAEKMIVDKEKIKDLLESNGIQCILTKPSDLSVNVINKYLEIKSKRLS